MGIGAVYLTRHAKAERYGRTTFWTPIDYVVDFDSEEEVEIIEE